MADLLEGRPVSRAIMARVRDDLERIVTQTGFAPGLAAVLTGEHPSAVAYLRAISRGLTRAGIPVRDVRLPDTVTEADFRRTIAGLNGTREVAGIIVLAPLPAHLPERIASQTIDPDKDVDGVTPMSAGRVTLGLDGFAPSTPTGGMEILRHYQIPVAGRHAVVLGRSAVVGQPMATLLLAADATVTVCHSRSSDLPGLTRTAYILVAAAGRAGLITPDLVKPGATVIDFGVNVGDDGIVGDVDPTVFEVAGALTPVPGGTGMVTTAILARNTLRAAQRQLGLAPVSD